MPPPAPYTAFAPTSSTTSGPLSAPTTYSSDADIAAVGRGLLERTLPRSAWTHAGHFAAAFWFLANRRLPAVPHELKAAIQAYNAVVGIAETDTTGFHQTITLASLRAAESFRTAVPNRPLFAACNALTASPLGRSDWLLAFWSRPRLTSLPARRAWLDPDLAPFPFANLH